MFDPPLDAPPILVALTIVAASTLGVATAIAPTAPLDAPRLAAAIDRVAASRAPATATHSTSADAIRIEPRRITTRRDSRTQSSVFVTGSITPVEPGTRLARVLHGDSPRSVFQSPVDLELAAKHARNQSADWHRNPAELHVRHVTWGELDVTLVGV